MIMMYTAAFLTGIFASMGVGGGMILIIYLTVFAGYPQIAAQGINLVYFLPIALLSVIIHTKNKLIEWKKMLLPVFAGVIFSAAGAFAAYSIDQKMLVKLYGGFILMIGIKELFYKGKSKKTSG